MSLAENIGTLPQPRGGNYELARFNALRHGVLSRYTVLPWEDGEEYLMLLDALVAEHEPQGPTEEHLVDGASGACGWAKVPRITALSSAAQICIARQQKQRSSTSPAMLRKKP